MVMSANHTSKFAALHRQWWRLHMSEKFSNGTINSKQINKTKTKPKSMHILLADRSSPNSDFF